MKLLEIDLFSLKYACALSTIKCDNFSEAAAVCLDNRKHKKGVKLKVEGDKIENFNLVWSEVSEKMRLSRNDLQDTVEDAAYCLAFLLIYHLTELQVIRQSKKETGFDYWLGKKNDDYPFQDKGR